MGSECGEALLGLSQAASDLHEGWFVRSSRRRWCVYQAPDCAHGSALSSATGWGRADFAAKNALALRVTSRESSHVRRPVSHNPSDAHAGRGARGLSGTTADDPSANDPSMDLRARPCVGLAPLSEIIADIR